MTILVCTGAYARDLGVYGTLWPIAEVDLRKIIFEESQQIDWNAFREHLLSRATSLTSVFSSNFLKNTENTYTKTRYITPCYRLHSDKVIDGIVLYRKGTQLNPLEYIQPKTALLFFDGKDLNQLRFAKNAIKKAPGILLPVVTQGEFFHLASILNQPVYFAYPHNIKHLHLTHIPSLVTIGKNKHQYELAITEFAIPYQVSDIVRCWRGCEKV